MHRRQRGRLRLVPQIIESERFQVLFRREVRNRRWPEIRLRQKRRQRRVFNAVPKLVESERLQILLGGGDVFVSEHHL